MQNGMTAMQAFARLTPRERQIAEAIHSGAARKEVAASIGISPGTLQNHIESIYLKLNVKSVEQMVLMVERAKPNPERPGK